MDSPRSTTSATNALMKPRGMLHARPNFAPGKRLVRRPAYRYSALRPMARAASGTVIHGLAVQVHVAVSTAVSLGGASAVSIRIRMDHTRTVGQAPSGR